MNCIVDELAKTATERVTSDILQDIGVSIATVRLSIATSDTLHDMEAESRR